MCRFATISCLTPAIMLLQFINDHIFTGVTTAHAERSPAAPFAATTFSRATIPSNTNHLQSRSVWRERKVRAWCASSFNPRLDDVLAQLKAAELKGMAAPDFPPA